MTKMAVPQSACAGIDVDGKPYRARDGIIDVPAGLEQRFRLAGCFPVAAPVRAPGFVCEGCGFHALIRTCGRCGGRCHPPGGPHDHTEE